MLTLEGIRAMGLYLLDALKAEKMVRFSRLCERLRADESLAGGATPSRVEKGAEHVDLQEAAWQLKDLGVVRITNLDESLVDPDLYRLAWPDISEEFVARLQKSRPDFLIELTDNGERVLAEGLSFRFRDPGYRIQARPASEWLMGAFNAKRGETLTLRQVMEGGHSGGKVVVHDDCGNEYRLGTDTYAWAFEATLWHHARAGNIRPACRTAEQEQVWSEFVGRTERPRRPDAGAPQPSGTSLSASRTPWTRPQLITLTTWNRKLRVVARGEALGFRLLPTGQSRARWRARTLRWSPPDGGCAQSPAPRLSRGAYPRARAWPRWCARH